VEPILPLTDDDPSILEPHLYAIEQRATAEFRKVEWVALDETNMVLHLEKSEIGKGMSDGESDIQLEANDCRIAYKAQLEAKYEMISL
jgi:hypothetical protein